LAGVIGVGLDVVDTAAFAEQLADAASGFVEATFRAGERRDLPPDARGRAVHLAGRFAAKEALVKAWSAARRGAAPALARVELRDVEVVADDFGRPALRLHGAVASAVNELAAGASLSSHLSISHDGPVAAAVVILEVAEATNGNRRSTAGRHGAIT
jgi:holo-[acyl-carrier protein] synthase